jgi:bifunctional UDP-N-acetylglucosamine pyrophosphorylase/glucosamine-1-phosphate N-acetyltransferase
MDGIILAGGKGTRMMPLTQNMPKPLLKVQGRPILEWSLRTLRPNVDHVIVVVKYLKEHIEGYMAQQTVFEHYTLVEQLPEPLGTGHALMCCAPHLRSDAFVVMNGDDLFGAAGVDALARAPLGILTVLRDDPWQYGVVITDDDNHVVRLHEKPMPDSYPVPAKVNIGAYKFNRSIFDYDLPLSSRNEYEITDYVSWLAHTSAVEAIVADFWLPIGNPQNLEDAQSVDLSPYMR